MGKKERRGVKRDAHTVTQSSKLSRGIFREWNHKLVDLSVPRGRGIGKDKGFLT